MAISTPTLLGTAGAQSDYAALSVSNITPTGGALIYVVSAWVNNPALDISIGTTLSMDSAFTVVEDISLDDSSAGNGRMKVWVGQASATPGTGSVTITTNTGGPRILHVIEIASGFNTTTPVAQSEQSSEGTSASTCNTSLGSAPATTSVVLHAAAGEAITGLTPDGDYTELADHARNAAADLALAVQYRTGSSDTDATYDGFNTGSSRYGIILEIAADGGGGGDVTAPTISNFSVTNPSGQNVLISFDSDEQLANIEVVVSGAESATLDETDFTESGTYTYTATHAGSTDGLYIATINTAEDAAANDGGSGQVASVWVGPGTEFFDHFAGSIPSEITTVTANSGTVTTTDGYLEIDRPASTDVAYAYLTSGVEIDTDWSLEVCSACIGTDQRLIFSLADKSDPGTAETFSNWASTLAIRVELALSGSTYHFNVRYFDSGGTQQFWNETSGAWSTTNTITANPEFQLGDYLRVRMENDGTNQRFRFALIGERAPSTSYTFSQGERLTALTSWVDWDTVRDTPQSNLQVFFAEPYNDTSTWEQRYEWIRYISGPLVEAWGNGKTNSSDDWDIRKMEGRGDIISPLDRSTIALQANGTTEGDTLKDQMILQDGSTYYLYYRTDASPPEIHVATSTDKATWTKSANNPLITVNGTTEDYAQFPYVIKDNSEADSDRRYKMLVNIRHVGTPDTYHTHLFTSPDPDDNFTDEGSIIGPGSASAYDELGHIETFAHWYNGQWEVYTGTRDGNAYAHVGRATGTSLSSLTKDANPFITFETGGDAQISANLTGRTVTIADTSGFSADQLICVTDDNVSSNWAIGRIRKVVDSTTLELYCGLDGFTSGTGHITQADNWHRIAIRYVEQVGSEWRFWVTLFEPFIHVANRNAYIETVARFVHSGTDPDSATPTLDALSHPYFPLHDYGWESSSENIAFVTQPLVRAVEEQLEGVLAGSSTASASLSLIKTVQSTGAGAATASAGLSVNKTLAATATGEATASAALSVNKRIAGTGAGVATASATVTTGGVEELEGVLAGSSTAAATLSVKRNVSAAASGASTASAGLSVNKRLSGALSGAATASASVSTGGHEDLAASVSGAATASCGITVTKRIAAVAQGEATLSGGITVEKHMAAMLSGVATASAALSVLSSTFATPSERTFVVEAESRVFAIESEDRTFTITR